MNEQIYLRLSLDESGALQIVDQHDRILAGVVELGTSLSVFKTQQLSVKLYCLDKTGEMISGTQNSMPESMSVIKLLRE